MIPAFPESPMKKPRDLHWTDWIVSSVSTGEALRVPELFERVAPLEIEVGCGKGRYLIAAAMARPDHDFLGIERKLATLRLCAGRAARRGLENVRLMKADAGTVLWGQIAPQSVAAVHVYYPDPWWKARHKKRRIFSPEFVADVARLLAKGGELRVATDVVEYFEAILEFVAASPCFERRPVAVEEFGTPEAPITTFQAKYVPLGRAINGALFVRTAAPAPETPDPRERFRILRERKRSRLPEHPEPEEREPSHRDLPPSE